MYCLLNENYNTNNFLYHPNYTCLCFMGTHGHFVRHTNLGADRGVEDLSAKSDCPNTWIRTSKIQTEQSQVRLTISTIRELYLL